MEYITTHKPEPSAKAELIDFGKAFLWVIFIIVISFLAGYFS